MNYNLIIIGGGPGGYKLAASALSLGQSVVLVEKDLLGGTCLNRGCIPTKCLLDCADAAADPADRFIMARKRVEEVVGQLRQGVEAETKDADVFHGEASLRKADNGKIIVCVDDKELIGDKIVIATGSQPAMLPIPGADLALTSDDVLALAELPESMIIIGGGVIGMEFAYALAGFGVKITVIEYCSEILPPFDAEVAKRLRTTLKRKGINIITSAAVSEIKKTDNGAIEVIYSDKKGSHSVESECAVMAVGRKPVVPRGAEDCGIELNKRGFIVADDNMLTSVPDVYAIGDVNGKCMLAHVAEAQGRKVLGHNVKLDIIPSAVFTHPECAMVGPTEQQLQASSTPYGTAKAMFAANGKALSMAEGEGFAKVIYDPSSKRLLAVHIIGPHASDIVAEGAACISLGATLEDVAISMVHNHPTLGEVLAQACEAALKKLEAQ